VSRSWRREIVRTATGEIDGERDVQSRLYGNQVQGDLLRIRTLDLSEVNVQEGVGSFTCGTR